MITTRLKKKKFDTLTKKEKRVAICKDVVARIDQRMIVPNAGMFWENKPDDDSWEISLKDHINNSKCEVCAKGALFCSWVGNFNEVTWDAVEPDMENVDLLKDASPELVKIFGRKMLDNIEAAFEGQSYDWHYDEMKTQEYANAFTNMDLRDIMKYIIKNEGKFPLKNNRNNKS